MRRNDEYLLVRLILFLFIFTGTIGTIYSQSSCDPTTPSFTVNLVGNPGGTWTSNPPLARNGHCCNVTGSDRCVEFVITLDVNAVGINFQIASGAVPPGALFYQIDCGPLIPVGSPICVNGPGPYRLTFCKPGSNINTYSITSIPRPEVSPATTTSDGCNVKIGASGIVESTVSWTSIAPGVQGQYNNYLNCTSGCDTVKVTPLPGYPAWVDYKVCGTPLGGACSAGTVFCDTIRVFFVPPIANAISPNPASFCANNPGVILNSVINGGLQPYTYIWKNNAGIVVGTNSTYNATSPGSYVLEVRDATYPGCPSKLSSVTVSVDPVPTVNAGPDKTVCPGNPTVSLSGAVTNATGGVWSGGSGIFSPNASTLNATYTPSASEITAGIVVLTLTTTGMGACNPVSDQMTIHITPPITITPIMPSIVCYGGKANITASVTGGTPPYQYSWSNGATTQTITNVNAGTYTVYVTDATANPCTRSASITLNQNQPLSLTVPSTNVITCDSSVYVNVNATGGGGGFTYLWNTGATTSGITVNSGIYIITATDVYGCQIKDTVTIQAAGSAIDVNVNQPSVQCYNGTATLMATGSGGFGGYIYGWNSGQSTQNITVPAGNYCVTVEDTVGCLYTRCVTVSEAPQLQVSIPTPSLICFGSTATVTATASGGTPPYTYQWNTGESTSSITKPAGTYSVTVTDANSNVCTVSGSVTISQSANMNLNFTSTSVSCYGGNNGTASVSVTGGTSPYNYAWSPYGGNVATAYTLSAGTYTVNVYDNNGCTKSGTVVVNQPPILNGTISAVNNVQCAGNLNGSATISASGGTPTYTYLWSPSGETNPTANSLGAGSNSVVIQDSKGCTKILTVNITEPNALTSAIGFSSNVSCNGGNDGTASVIASGGSSPYTYIWQETGDNTSSVSNLFAGNYNITIQDAGGCVSQSMVTIQQPSALTASITSSSNISCFGAGNGSATVTATGGSPGYSYSWSNSGGNTASVSGLQPNSYTVTVTDIEGCQATASVLLTQPTPLMFTVASATTVTCAGACNGQVTATASGGNGNYQYLWTPGNYTTSTVSNLCAGTYSVRVTDQNGCYRDTTLIINEPQQLQVNLNITGSNCSQPNGSASALVSGGTPAYTYSWSTMPPQTASVASGLLPGTYSVKVTDNRGCNTSNSVIIPNIPGVNAAIATATNIPCNGTCTGTANVSATGGTLPYTYSWNTIPAQTTANATGLCAGNYIVRVTGADGCSDTASVSIIQPTALILSQVSITPVNCFGNSTGSVTVNASGGAGSYLYSWDPSTIQGPVAAGLTAGNYICTVSDANNCIDTIHVQIQQPSSALQLSVTNTNLNCFGGNNGSATASVSGGTPGYTYSWNTIPSQNSPVASNITAGTYSVSVTDNKGCNLVSSPVVVTQPNSTMQLNVTYTNVDCFGNNSGSAQATVNGGTSPYNFTWSTTPAQTGPIAMNLVAGTYSVSVSDAYGCSVNSSPVVITQPMAGLSVSTSVTNIACYGAQTGSAQANASGGTTPYTYNWSTTPVQNTPSVNSLAAGTYTLIVTDQNGCSYTNNAVAINQPLSNMQQSINHTNVNCYGGNTASATISISGGSPGYTYSWSTVPFQNTPTASNLSAGTYSVEVTDSKSCNIISSPIIITQPNAPLTVGVIPVNIQCFGNSNGTIQANVSGGTQPYTYSWNTTPPQNGSNANGLGAGVYNVTITDANGCSIQKPQIVLSQPPGGLNLSVTTHHVACNGDTSGYAEANVSGGSFPYTYSWSTTPSQNTALATPLAAGTYTLHVTDQNGCFASNNQVVINEPISGLQINVTQTNVNCFGNATGTATASVSGGTGSYTYSWNTTPPQFTSIASNLSAGTYAVEVTDANGCSLTSNPVVITQPLAQLAVSTNSNNVGCFGDNTGSITTSVSGGTSAYTYSWNTTPVQTGSTLSGIGAGTYYVSVTDAKGCLVQTPVITITQPSAALGVSVTKNNVSCFGDPSGNATANVTGGTTPYTYSWSTNPVQTTGVASSLTAGTYSLLVTDQNGCAYTNNSIVITQPNAALNASITSTNINCYGDNTGTAEATVNGGTQPYTYNWNTTPAQNTAQISSLAAGTYSFTVTDGNGCIYQAGQTIISQPAAALAVSSSKTDILCFGQSTGAASVYPSGGTQPYTYSWNTSPVQTTQGITNLLAGFYSVTVTDGNGCTFAANPIQINQPSAMLTASSSATNVSCFGGYDGTATVNTSGGTSPYTYSWNSSPLQSSQTAAGLPAGTYFVKVTDGNGCVSTSNNVSITQPTDLIVSITGTVAPGCAANNGSATASASGGTGPYFYSWNTTPAQTLATASNLYAGNYMATVTDMRGCKDSVSVTLNQPQPVFFVSAGAFPTTCNESCDGYAVVIAGGGIAPYTYSWSNGGTGPAINDVCEGYYTIYVYDNQGCYTDTVLHVTSPVPITLTSTVTPSNCYQNNGSATVVPSGGMAAYSYSWNTTPPSYSATVNGVVPGNYSVLVTDSRGCKSSAVVNVPNVPGVKLTTSIVTNTLCKDSCDGTATVTAMSGSAPYTYFWNTTPPQFAASANGLCAGSYKATVRDNDGCWDTLSVEVFEPEYINVLSPDSPTICIGQSVTLTANATGGNGVFTYNWNNGSNNGASYTVSPIVTSNYSLVVNDSNGCRSQTMIFPVNVNAPLSVVKIDGDSICPGEIATVTSFVTGGDGQYQYLWIPGNLTTAQFQASPSTTTNYTLTVKDGCGSPQTQDSIDIVVHGVPQISFTPDAREGCKPLCVRFENNSTVSSGNIASWSWTASNGMGSTDASPTICFNEDGSSDIRVEATSNYGCKSMIDFTDYIQVHPDPVAEFTFGPQPADILNPLIRFTDQSEGAVAWHWSFNDRGSDSFSTESNPVCMYSDTGNFCPILRVTSAYGCISEKENCLYITPEFSFYVPNAFSPNGDGYNETFNGTGTLIQQYEMRIFDRWGNLIYMTEDIDKPWDGTANGGDGISQEDVYVYKIKVWDQNRRIHNYMGSVTLVK